MSHEATPVSSVAKSKTCDSGLGGQCTWSSTGVGQGMGGLRGGDGAPFCCVVGGCIGRVL